MKNIKLFFSLFTILTLFSACVAPSSETHNDFVGEERDSTAPTNDRDKIRYIFDKEFNEEDQEKLIVWIDSVFKATEQTLGVYNFDTDVHFHYNDSKKKAVTFGYTKRGKVEQVHLDVNPKFSLNELLDDWIAPHEISHLAIGALGKDAKWFFEGFATFLSRQINMNLGLITQSEFDSLYYHNIMDKKGAYLGNDISFIDQSKKLFTQNKYGSVYWGSTSFFYIIDKKLFEEKGIRFKDILVEYQKCCRADDINLKETILNFDKIIGENWCHELMLVYRNEPALEVFNRVEAY